MELRTQEREKMRRFLEVLVNNPDIAEDMITEEGIDVNADICETPLHFAVRRNNLRAVQFFLGRGVKINNKNGWRYDSPLFAAVRMHNGTGVTCDILNLLLGNGADCNQRGSN